MAREIGPRLPVHVGGRRLPLFSSEGFEKLVQFTLLRISNRK
jgi:hypothetical protein